MSEHPGPVNPFEAPAIGWTPPALAADTEFLFNDQCLAGIGTIKLPRICVVSGATDDLESRVGRFSTCSRWIVVPRNLLLVFSVFAAIPALIEVSSRSGAGLRANSPGFMISALLSAGVLAGAIVMVLLSLMVRKWVEVHWYESRSVIARQRRWRAAKILLRLIGAAVMTIVAVSASFSPGGLGLAVVFVVIGLVLGLGGFKHQRSLVALGEHEGLVLIGGFSEAFLKQVQTLVAQYDARETSEIPSATSSP